MSDLFEPHKILCYACGVRDVLTLVSIFLFGQNPGWVTDDSYYEEFPEDFYVGDPPVGRPCVGTAKL